MKEKVKAISNKDNLLALKYKKREICLSNRFLEDKTIMGRTVKGIFHRANNELLSSEEREFWKAIGIYLKTISDF